MALCPHLLSDYFQKVNDIVKVYRSQIVEQVEYETVCEELVFRRVISLKLDEEISIFSGTNTEKMDKVLDIIPHRTWGLESLIMALMRDKCYVWLSEQLFQSYVRYLVSHIRKQKSLQKCDCPNSESVSSFFNLNKRWNTFLESLDLWIFDIGTSIGFLDQALYPTQNILSFINDRIPLRRRQVTETELCMSVPFQNCKSTCSNDIVRRKSHPKNEKLSLVTITEIMGHSHTDLFEDYKEKPAMEKLVRSLSHQELCTTYEPLEITDLHNKSSSLFLKEDLKKLSSEDNLIVSDLEWDYDHNTELLENTLDFKTLTSENGTQT